MAVADESPPRKLAIFSSERWISWMAALHRRPPGYEIYQPCYTNPLDFGIPAEPRQRREPQSNDHRS
jgi:hypothetical protein